LKQLQKPRMSGNPAGQNVWVKSKSF